MPSRYIYQIEDKKGKNRTFFDFRVNGFGRSPRNKRGVGVFPTKSGIKPPLWGFLARRVRGGGLTELCTASAVAIPVLAGN